MTLQLEYTCTEAEVKAAQALHLRQHYGGGSKWRTRLILFGILVFTLAVGWLRFKTEVAPEDRWWFVTLVIVIFFAVLFFQRMAGRKRDKPTRLEISEREAVFIGSNGRTTMPWSAFGQCLESPALFVLINRPKTILWTVPKRAFPDENSRDWFRTLAEQLQNAPTAAGEIPAPGRLAAKGITLTVQLGYRDYLTRMVTSWRARGIALVIFALVIGTFLYAMAHPSPHPVVSPGKVFFITMATFFPMVAVMFLLITFISWRSEKKFVEPQQVALSSEGIQFESSDASGLLAWSTYKYYLENRWAFFVWNPQGSLWMMFPKREFTSQIDIEQCRDLLRTNLKASRWFYL